ncbi:3'-5' exonuclease [Nocardia farcinica]|uniref:Putative DNA polymerase n=1 Tax=Nocardia farcinica (strain IFM 10152) TaxID=247156 RepID=Q5YSF0_NOCFA|nr:3'-5' exonuclease [Nocardia farcinica]BAD58891.1 putative DNA polymerase [Nocardia farcinica IFM 10152]
MTWTQLPLAAFDLETTSADPHSARVVTASIIRVDGGDVRARNWIANPHIPIPAEATEIHGYTDEYVQKHGRPHADVIAEVTAELHACWAEGRCVAVYNGSFDFTVLATHDPSFAVSGLVVDAFVLDKKYDRYRRGSRKLSAVCIHYGVQMDAAHDAQADATAAARLAWKLPRIYPALAEYTPTELMEAQTAWYAQQAASFIDYLRRNDRPFDDVRTEWPIARPSESNAA